VQASKAESNEVLLGLRGSLYSVAQIKEEEDLLNCGAEML